jgi:hypothetical protein
MSVVPSIEIFDQRLVVTRIIEVLWQGGNVPILEKSVIQSLVDVGKACPDVSYCLYVSTRY